MAIKHKEPQACVNKRLQLMLRKLQSMHSERSYPKEDLARICENIVQCLGVLTVPSNLAAISSFMIDIINVQDMLSNACTTGPNSEELIFVALKALYTDISNPTKKTSPAMSIVLQLIEPKLIPKAVTRILNSGYPEPSLEQAFSTLCSWLSRWTCTPNLGPLVLAFTKGLESQKHYSTLINVSLHYVDRLFLLLLLPDQRNSVGPVVLYMLSRLQHSPKGFHKVVPHVLTVVSSLQKENTEASLICLQEIVNLYTALMEHFPGYQELYQILQNNRHGFSPSSNYKAVLNCRSWYDDTKYADALVNFEGKVGLNNLGNTCYMNSVLQALFMTKLFCNDVLGIGNSTVMVSKLQELFALLQHSQRVTLSPSDILHIARPPGFTPGHQHDSSEFLGYLLDNLHEQQMSLLGNCMEGNDMATCASNMPCTTHINTAVQRSFGGITMTVSKCDTCTTQSERMDKFRELQLSFPNNSDDQSVQTLLDYYLQPEHLSGDNQYRCDNCVKLTDGQRVTRLVELPPRLVLTLKHFRYDPTSQQRTKLLQRVRLDSCVHLDAYKYELYAAVVHCGSSVDSGHYYTFAKDAQGWYKFNDCSVNTSSSSELCELKPPETPYILFYNRQDCIEPEPLPRSELLPHVEAVLARDQAEQDAESNRRRPKRSASLRREHDDEPPPGCGGGSLFGNNASRYVY